MGLNETLLGVIDELYAGALDQVRLTSSLGAIASAIHASGGLMYLAGDGHRMLFSAVANFDLGPPSIVDAEHANMLLGFYRRMPLNSVVHVHSFWPVREMLKTSYYQEVLKRQDVMYGAACLVFRKPGFHAVATLNRSERVGPFSDADIGVLRLLTPHLNRVMQITLEMNAIARERETFASALDRLSAGVVLTDSRGKVLHLNRAAERIASRCDGLAVKQGRLIANVQDDDHALARLIAQASSADGQSFERGGTCTIRRSSGLPPYLAIVTPCSDWQARAFVPMLPACVVLIRDPSQRSPDAVFQLRQMFGLTPQESKVAVGIADGHGLAGVAEIMGLRTLTVRNHLQRVFFKTGTSRQAELARLVGALSN